MPLHPRTCCLLYSVSCLLDALDGLAARKFNQSTKFGAVLDMVTDRCTTACLLVFLASAFPRWSIVFQGLISLDLASHYMHMYATLTMGGSGQSHKKVDEGRSWILKQYYSNNVGLHVLISEDDAYQKLATGCALHILRTERNVLHCTLPPIVLLATTFPFAPPTFAIKPSTRQPSRTEAVHAIHEPMVSRSNGNGKVSTIQARQLKRKVSNTE
jgi:hypothetical protein